MRLDVGAGGYVAASQVFGADIAPGLQRVVSTLSGELAGLHGMAGSDPTGLAWAGAYDSAVSELRDAAAGLVEGCVTLAVLLEQTGFNYALAESQSVTGRMRPTLPDRTDYRGTTASVPAIAPVVAEAGSGVALPRGWSLIQHLVGSVWPNGHQDRLRKAADLWDDAALRMTSVADFVAQAEATVRLQTAPEVADALVLCGAVRDRVGQLAGGCRGLGRACEQLAARIDHAHHEILHELDSLMDWTIAFQAAGGLTAWCTLGFSEVAAQSAQVAKIAATASRVAAIVAEFGRLAGVVRDAVTAVAARMYELSGEIRPLLSRQAVEADVAAVPGDLLGLEGPAKRGVAVATTPEAAATADLVEATRVGSAAETWADSRTLARHFQAHARDFGSSSPEAYARQAAEFLRRARREHLPMKLDGDGTMRIYDPTANEFGAYSADGRTRTYFKPSRGARYWQSQKGTLDHA